MSSAVAYLYVISRMYPSLLRFRLLYKGTLFLTDKEESVGFIAVHGCKNQVFKLFLFKIVKQFLYPFFRVMPEHRPFRKFKCSVDAKLRLIPGISLSKSAPHFSCDESFPNAGLVISPYTAFSRSHAS